MGLMDEVPEIVVGEEGYVGGLRVCMVELECAEVLEIEV